MDQACTNIQLLYTNDYRTGTNPQESGVGNDVFLYKVAFEYAGTDVPVTFNHGSVSVTIPNGGYVLSDPVSVTLASNEEVYSRTGWQVAPGQYTPQVNLWYPGLGQPGTDTFYAGDAVYGVGALSDKSYYGYGPTAILGEVGTPTPFVAVLGDSIIDSDVPYMSLSLESSEGNYMASDGGGWVNRMLRQDDIGFLDLSCGGERGADWTDANTQERMPLACMASCWLIAYGRNDLYPGAAAAVETTLLAIANQAAALGIAPIAVTLAPQSTSTDGWTSTAGQTTTRY